MDAEQVRRWLSYLGESDVDDEGSEWVQTHCPLAPWRHERGTDTNPSFGVKIQPGQDSRVHCFSCNYSGTQTDLLISLSSCLKGEPHALDIRSAMRMVVEVEDGGTDLALDWDEEDQEPAADVVFPESWLETFAPAYASGMVHPYLEKRGVPYEVASMLDLRFMLREQRVCFPVRNWDGQLVGLHGRCIVDEVQPSYRMITWKGKKNPLAWLGESWVDPEKTVVLAESVFDLARVMQVYRNVACPLTASISTNKVKRIAGFDHVVVFFDPDKAGEEARRKVDHVLGQSADVRHVRPIDDRDPGAMSPAEVAECLEGIVDLDPVIA